MTASSWTLTARWILPIDRPPLPHGVLTINGERIVAIEPHGHRSADVDLGEVAVLPGLVNAHTHLDLTGLRGQCPPTPDFPQWLRSVIRHRRSRTEAQVLEDVKAGVVECVRFGTTLIGDIAAGGVSWPVLAAASLRAVVFYELLGLPLTRARQALEIARSWSQDHSATPTDLCRPGVSPHAPYSVHWFLFPELAIETARSNMVAATHVAETLAELELLQEHQGPFVPFLQELGVWEEEGLWRLPLEKFGQLSMLSGRWLLIHGNYLPVDMAFSPTTTVVFCPRTHAAFGHASHPFPRWLERGTRIALGTDSLASNPDLDVLAEARFVREHYPQVAPAQILRMATLSGAEALGWEDDTGSLTPGKSADLVTVPLGKRPEDPFDAVLRGGEPVQAVLWRGRWLSEPRET